MAPEALLWTAGVSHVSMPSARSPEPNTSPTFVYLKKMLFNLYAFAGIYFLMNSQKDVHESCPDASNSC